MRLSIVSTLYRSAPYLREFHARVRTAAGRITPNFEIILVNDGSPDDSLEIARSLVAADPKLRVIDLSRNFGHHKAIMTGLAYASGELVFLIDSDLEEAPELVGEFYERMQAAGVDVVYGVQVGRKGGWWEQVSGTLFYKSLGWLSSTPIPANIVTARLMSQRYVKALVAHRDREIFLAGLWQITGFAQLGLPVQKLDKGESSYNLTRKVSVLVNAVTSFSSRPLTFIFYLGAVLVLVAGGAALYLVLESLFFKSFQPGWPSVIVSIWLMGGLSLFALGLIGIYLSRVFTETKERPYTIVRDIFGEPKD